MSDETRTDDGWDLAPPGSVVRLRSGGPLMTAIGRSREGTHCTTGGGRVHVKCAWFDERHRARKETFPVACLIVDRTPAEGRTREVTA